MAEVSADISLGRIHIGPKAQIETHDVRPYILINNSCILDLKNDSYLKINLIY